MTKDFNWENWKMTNIGETLKRFRETDKEYLLPVIQKDTIPTKNTETS